MSGRLRACGSYRRIPLTEDWQATSGADGESGWLPAPVPGTAAASLRDAGRWSFEAPPRAFDAEEWSYRIRFAAEPAASGERIILGLDGLATLAKVTMNGAVLLDSTNMFLEHRCDVTSTLQGDNELLIRFAPLNTMLNVRRPRPRWRTPMVAHQQLRWARTSLLGRTPGWSPPAAPVGPWRPVWLERRRLVEIAEHRLLAEVSGADGSIRFSCQMAALSGSTIRSVRLTAARNGRQAQADLAIEGANVHGDLTLPNVDLWWPHTHGEPALYQISLSIEVQDAEGRQQVEADFGSIGFRSLRLDRSAGRFALSVNGHEVFCRGAAWMPLDCVSLQATDADYRAAIAQVRDAGMNMLRLTGPTVYETDSFFDHCDSAGILVWQDFMFANMDYPAADPAFAASVRLEVTQQLARLQGRPSLAMLCGNSEGAQQAAMSGAGREHWAPALFEMELAALSDELSPGVPYCPSSTHGGAFPFQPNEGVTSYYGVGAYLKPLSDARRSGLRFASECLAFANVPEEETLALLAPGQALRCHHARWKERVPRDMGAGWDFDDVRDHYLEQLFHVDAMRLRYADHDRYLQMGRVASGEVMAAAFAEWRLSASSCSGALIWFLNDLWPGAGWGVIDSTGLPKAAYYYVKRVLQRLALAVTDEDCNGLMIHLTNEAATGVRAKLELRLFKASAPVGLPVAKHVSLEPRAKLQIAATDLFEGFMDLSYTFRFGPPSYDVLHAALYAEDDGSLLTETFHFPLGIPNTMGEDVGLTASASLEGANWQLKIACRGFAQSVHVLAPGFVASDQYFHMAPGSTRTLTLRPRGRTNPAALEGAIRSLNAASSSFIGIAP